MVNFFGGGSARHTPRRRTRDLAIESRKRKKGTWVRGGALGRLRRASSRSRIRPRPSAEIRARRSGRRFRDPGDWRRTECGESVGGEFHGRGARAGPTAWEARIMAAGAAWKADFMGLGLSLHERQGGPDLVIHSSSVRGSGRTNTPPEGENSPLVEGPRSAEKCVNGLSSR